MLNNRERALTICDHDTVGTESFTKLSRGADVHWRRHIDYVLKCGVMDKEVDVG